MCDEVVRYTLTKSGQSQNTLPYSVLCIWLIGERSVLTQIDHLIHICIFVALQDFNINWTFKTLIKLESLVGNTYLGVHNSSV